MGVWIEIEPGAGSRGGGNVTPCVGVWIEILIRRSMPHTSAGHSLRGSVD